MLRILSKRENHSIRIILCLQLLYIGFPVNLSAQLNRSNQANNIISNIYQNTTHAITGATLQSVMLNQNNSYANVLSDTLLFDVRNFNSSLSYSPGMGCFYHDTLFRDSIPHFGTWNRNHFIKIGSYDGVSGWGTPYFLPRWIGTKSLGNSDVYDDGGGNRKLMGMNGNMAIISVDWFNGILSDSVGSVTENYSRKLLYDTDAHISVQWNRRQLWAANFGSNGYLSYGDGINPIHTADIICWGYLHSIISGTTNYIPVFTGSMSFGNSYISQNPTIHIIHMPLFTGDSEPTQQITTLGYYPGPNCLQIVNNSSSLYTSIGDINHISNGLVCNIDQVNGIANLSDQGFNQVQVNGNYSIDMGDVNGVENGTSLTLSDPDLTATFSNYYYVAMPAVAGNSRTPNFTLGPAAGTISPSATISGTNLGGVISVTTGSDPSLPSNAHLIVVYFNGMSFPSDSYITLTPGNAFGASLQFWIAGTSDSEFVISVDKPQPSITYIYYYTVVGQ